MIFDPTRLDLMGLDCNMDFNSQMGPTKFGDPVGQGSRFSRNSEVF
jgi:hypothetical protein